jgi:cytochrome c oxidase subunit 2
MGNFLGTDPKDAAAADDIVAPQNILLLPEGKTVVLKIRSLDVIHSFFLPHHRVKQDAMPGMTIDTWFMPTKAGKYEIACAEHCGLGHYRMKGAVHVLSAADFQSATASQEAFDAALAKLQ